VDSEHSRHEGWLKDYARRRIKRFSHPKSKENLTALIDRNSVIEGPCVSEIPLSILKLISDGIAAMRREREKVLT
jgi:hypothetical protein